MRKAQKRQRKKITTNCMITGVTILRGQQFRQLQYQYKSLDLAVNITLLSRLVVLVCHQIY